MLRSTFSGFTIAQNAMQASQYALQVTGQNIANIKTHGYTQQRLDLISLNLRNSSQIPGIGFGVEVTGISQIRDPFLDIQYRNQIAKVSTADAKQSTLDSLNNIFDETEKEGIRQAFSDLMSGLETLSGKVGNEENDSIVRSQMQVILNAMHAKASDLAGVRSELQNGMAETTVPEVNQILESLSKLNSAIWDSQIAGNPALELQDQRNVLVDQLASYLPINVTYKSHKIATGESLSTMNITFKGNTANYPLVSHDKVGSFSFATAGGQGVLSLTPVGASASEDITQQVGEGTFKGVLDMLNQEGTLTGEPTKGVGYYERTFDALVHTFATTFNDLNKGYVGNTPVSWPLFETTDGSATFTASNIKISDDWMNNTTHIIPSQKPDAGSTDNTNILNMINALKEDRDFVAGGVNFYNGSISNCYANIENILGIDSKANFSILNNHSAVLRETAKARDSVSGVSLDDEGMNLLHYQKSYAAAARLMTTLDEALDTLINKTGIVGR